MGVVHSPDSKFAQERRLHEAHYGPFGQPGRPYQKRDYPMMVHLAGRNANGSPDIVETKIVDNDDQRDRARQDGFREGPNEALAHLHAQDTEIATLAANRTFNEQRMTPKAQEEAAKADLSTGNHLPSVPETPLPAKSGRMTVTPPRAAGV